MAGIFISYRQDDSKPWAIGLRNDLANWFGKDQVYLDKEDLGAGSWRDQLECALKKCSVVLVAIGRKWLTITDEHNRPRIGLPDDVHRQEIALALSRQGVTVIPILFDDAMMPRAEQLPEDIRSLTDQQAYKIGDTEARREADLKVLVKGIEAVGGPFVREAVADDKEGSSSENRPSWYKLDLQVVAIACAVTTILYVGISNMGDDKPGGREIAGWVLVSYILVFIGKFLWRRVVTRRRRGK